MGIFGRNAGIVSAKIFRISGGIVVLSTFWRYSSKHPMNIVRVLDEYLKRNFSNILWRNLSKKSSNFSSKNLRRNVWSYVCLSMLPPQPATVGLKLGESFLVLLLSAPTSHPNDRSLEAPRGLPKMVSSHDRMESTRSTDRSIAVWFATAEQLIPNSPSRLVRAERKSARKIVAGPNRTVSQRSSLLKKIGKNP